MSYIKFGWSTIKATLLPTLCHKLRDVQFPKTARPHHSRLCGLNAYSCAPIARSGFENPESKRENAIASAQLFEFSTLLHISPLPLPPRRSYFLDSSIKDQSGDLLVAQFGGSSWYLAPGCSLLSIASVLGKILIMA